MQEFTHNIAGIAYLSANQTNSLRLQLNLLRLTGRFPANQTEMGAIMKNIQ